MVTIPPPTFLEGISRGLGARTGFAGKTGTFRFNMADYELIHEEAVHAGVSDNEFLLWCAKHVAAVLQRERTGVYPVIAARAAE